MNDNYLTLFFQLWAGFTIACFILILFLAGGRPTKERLQFLTGVIDCRDVVTFGGLALIGYGAQLIFEPAAYIIIGAGLFWLGVRRLGNTQPPGD